MRLASPASRDGIRLRIEPADLLSIIAAPFVSLALRDPALLDLGAFPLEIPAPYRYAFITIGCAILTLLGFRLSDRMGQFFSVRDAFAVCSASVCAVVSSSLVLFAIAGMEGVPRSTPLIYGLVLSAGMIAFRLTTRVLHKDMRWERAALGSFAPPADLRRVIVVGVDRLASAAIKLTDELRPRTTQIVAALDGRSALVGRKITGVSIVGGPRDIGAVIDEYAVHGVEIDQVWLSRDEAHLSGELYEDVVAQCEARGVAIVGGAEALALVASPPPGSAPETAEVLQAPEYFKLKRLIDLCAATVLLVVTFPVAICVAYVALLDVGAPVLFWQQRIGKNGQKFLLYKFRTYRAPFDRNGRPVPEDRRLSRIGRFIRAIRVDEIPQLYNVIAGHMSLIGPRPLLPHDQPDDPGRRLSVRPGVTGWAQINGGTSVSPEEKNALDVWYIEHASLWLDLEIAVGTLLVALSGERLNGRAIDQAIHWYRQEFEPDASGARKRGDEPPRDLWKRRGPALDLDLEPAHDQPGFN